MEGDGRGGRRWKGRQEGGEGGRREGVQQGLVLAPPLAPHESTADFQGFPFFQSAPFLGIANSGSTLRATARGGIGVQKPLAAGL